MIPLIVLVIVIIAVGFFSYDPVEVTISTIIFGGMIVFILNYLLAYANTYIDVEKHSLQPINGKCYILTNDKIHFMYNNSLKEKHLTEVNFTSSRSNEIRILHERTEGNLWSFVNATTTTYEFPNECESQ